MILDELDSKLMDLENARTFAERERATLETTDSGWSSLRTAGMPYWGPWLGCCLEPWPASAEDKNRLYRMLRLEVVPTGHGYEVSGVFGTPASSRPRV